jgi:hypothetical protein
VSRRLLGALLLLLAGIGAVVGTFLPLYWQAVSGEPGAPRFSTTSWRVRYDNVPSGLDIDVTQSPQFGVPIVTAAVLLAVAAALVFLPEAQRLAARYLAIGATGLLVGAVSATGSVAAAMIDNWDASGTDEFSMGVGEGLLLLSVSVLVAVVGVVLVHARRVAPGPEGPVVYRVEDDVEADDTDTPPFGIPVGGIEVAQLPETRYERPVDASDPGEKAT